MRNPHYKKIALLSIASAVRLMEQPSNPKWELPDFDEHGFPIMAGNDEFYRLLTDFGKSKVVVMTFAPETADDSITNWTFFVRLGDRFEPEDDQIVLKQNDSYIVCSAGEREWFPDASVFGAVAHKSNNYERDATQTESDEFDEFDQTDNPNRGGWSSPFRNELERAKLRAETLETHYDYDTDFGA